MEVMLLELEGQKDYLSTRKIDTVYFGGAQERSAVCDARLADVSDVDVRQEVQNMMHNGDANHKQVAFLYSSPSKTKSV